ncbi:MAG: FtsX-like permease family protein [Verrucomicrobia bacterium]|nr:MAG: FtsX-like permease family protein [Verrucomicrobiota bacterium]
MNLFSEIREGLHISWAAIRANKLRAVLTTLGIIIGIVTVTLMGAAIQGLNKVFLTSVSAVGTDVFYIQKFPWFSDEPWWKIRNRREIYIPDGQSFIRNANPAWAVTLQSVGLRSVKYEKSIATSVVLVGTTENGYLTDGVTLKDGRYLSASEVDGNRPVCVLGADIANKFFPNGGGVGQRVRIEDTGFEVIGILDKRGKFLGLENLDNSAYIPITRMARGFTFWPGCRIVCKVGGLSKIEDSKEEVRGVMRKVRRIAPADPDDFSVNSSEALIKAFTRMSTVIGGVGLFITGLSLFVGGIGIMNIMFVSVAERTREIGVRKAVGAKRRTILIQFLIEAATICLIGGLIGLSIAWVVTLAISKIFPATLSLPIVGIALVVSALTGVIAGFLPAWRAARMNPVDALRAE